MCLNSMANHLSKVLFLIFKNSKKGKFQFSPASFGHKYFFKFGEILQKQGFNNGYDSC